MEKNLEARIGQHELETLLNSMQDAVIAMGADGRVQWANPEWRACCAVILVSMRRSSTACATRISWLPFRMRRAIRSLPRHARTTISPNMHVDRDAPACRKGVVAVLRDLTETERMEKTRRDFIANVSHELRTPLTSIQGYTEKETLRKAGKRDHVRDF